MDNKNKLYENGVSGQVNARNVIIKTASGEIIEGSINLFSEGQYGIDRVSDFMIKGKNEFITVFKAQLTDKPQNTIIVNKQRIEWIIPDEKKTELKNSLEQESP